MPQSAGSDTKLTHKLIEVTHNMACAPGRSRNQWVSRQELGVLAFPEQLPSLPRAGPAGWLAGWLAGCVAGTNLGWQLQT
eukprot:7782483-Heterocapsa_arctica.AAC.1